MPPDIKGEAVDELLQFLSEAPEFVCVAGRRFQRFARGDFRLQRFSGGLEFQCRGLHGRVEGSRWRRSTHRFSSSGRAGMVLLKPSRKNELWLRRQRFRWGCEDLVRGRWKVVRTSFVLSRDGNSAILRMVLYKHGSWIVAVAAGAEEEVHAEAVLSQLFVHWRKFELSSARQVEEGLLFIPRELAEMAAPLLRELRSAVKIYCLPDLRRFLPGEEASFPLLWPSPAVRAEMEALQGSFAFSPEVLAVIRNGRECSFEYLGIPFAVYQTGSAEWRFPLREQETASRICVPGGEDAARMAREEYQRIREIRRPHARVHSDVLFQRCSERWLESLIVRDPKLLDRDLKSSPVYAQVPAYVTRRRVIDLVAVTESGRLVVIEVKVLKELDLLYQGLAYWGIVREAQQHNAFQQNGYFTGIRLSSEPPLLYCVTPLLALHAEIRHLASRLRPEIEAYLIGINNQWRGGLKVLRKERL
ncbi:MAG TPA: hypothetical protein VGL91_06735 [Acidobacteriota bacterium]